MQLQAFLDTLSGLDPLVVYGALLLGALVEYVVPPFPGDTVVVAGAALVGALGWPVLPVLGAVTAGAVIGASIDLWVGRLVARSGRLEALSKGKKAAVDDLVGRFERYGAGYLALNRFVPGIRALFFVAAGVAGLRTVPVLAWAMVSALAWNGLLIGLGLWLGSNVELLATIVERYTAVVGAVVLGVVALAIWRAWRVARTAEISGR